MSKDTKDWSRSAERLFRTARTAHAPTASDRVRVRQALARRLGAVSSGIEPAADEVQQRTAFTAAVPADLAKVGLGLVVIWASTYGAMHVWVPPRPEGPTREVVAAGAQNVPEDARAQTRAPASVTSFSTPVPVRSHPSESPRAQGRLAARQIVTTGTGPGRAPAPEEDPAVTPNLGTKRDNPGAAREVPYSSLRQARQRPAAARARPNQRTGHAPAATVTRAQSTRPVERLVEHPAERERNQPNEKHEKAPALDVSGDARAELIFIGRVQSRLRELKPQRALALCAEHEVRWPLGTFVQEREGLRVIAACQLSQPDAGSRASTFFKEYPRSPLITRVRGACRQQLAGADP